MAAPIKKLRWKQTSRILQNIGIHRKEFGSLSKLSMQKSLPILNKPEIIGNSVPESRNCGLFGAGIRTLGVSTNANKNSSVSSALWHILMRRNDVTNSQITRQLTTTPARYKPSNEDKPPKEEHNFRLMDFSELIWPHPLKTLKNVFLSFLIKNYMDIFFTQKNFLSGTEQAIATVSRLVSLGKFDDLDGLVGKVAVDEIRRNYNDLSSQQKQLIAVDPKDIFYRFIYEIGMIFDDQTNQRFVEITTVFQGYVGLGEMKERGESPTDQEGHSMETAADNVYVCNYRLIREYTKGIESEWTINKLNHFFPRDLVKSTNFFNR